MAAQNQQNHWNFQTLSNNLNNNNANSTNNINNTNPLAGLSASSLANLLSLTQSGQLQLLQSQANLYDQHTQQQLQQQQFLAQAATNLINGVNNNANVNQTNNNNISNASSTMNNSTSNSTNNNNSNEAVAALLARLATSLINNILPYNVPTSIINQPCNTINAHSNAINSTANIHSIAATNLSNSNIINGHHNNQHHHQQQLHHLQQQQQHLNHLTNLNQWQSNFDSTSLRLLSSLYEMNDEPDDDAIKMIAERINSSFNSVANYFHKRREADRNSLKILSSSGLDWNNSNSLTGIGTQNITCLSPNAFENEKPHPPSAPSSTLLAKLTAVTSRPNAHIMARQLDPKMIDLLEAFYTINDNPEPSAIEMIAKRINSSVDLVSDWFDNKRAKLNPHSGPRTPPAKKREGGRVVTFSEYQRSLLEAIFDENNYLHPQEYEELSNLIQVPARNIKIWFKNRRSKQRLSGRITTPVSANHLDR